MRAALTLLPLLLAAPAAAAVVQQPHSTAELIAERPAVQPGETVTVGLRLRLDEGWHVYWKNPGDSGMATRIAWTLPSGFSAGPMQWPAPKRIDVPPLTSYGYENEVIHLTEIRAPADAVPGTPVRFQARADWLVCEKICIPASADLDVALPVATTPAAADPRWASAFARTREATPVPLAGWEAKAYRDHATVLIRLVSETGPVRLRDLSFFPDQEGVIANAEEQHLTRRGQTYELRIAAAPQPIGDPTRLTGVLVATPGFGNSAAATIDVPFSAGMPSASRASPIGLSLAAAILLAFAGGVVLNLMPCVFPVLAIKALGVAQRGHGNARRLRTHGLLFALGVVLSFWAIAGLLLGLRAGGMELGWGYQLQSPVIVAGLAALFFTLGLNLSGVFEVGAGLQALAGDLRTKGWHADALLSGLLVTLVASPCTAPFMGAALGFALVQPALDAMLVFTALALGMALPYVVLCFAPALVRRLPRPGRWMDTLKQLLAFPLYATVVWLVWVLGQQVGIDGAARFLAGLVILAAALWTVGHWAHSPRRARALSQTVAAALVAGALVLAWPQPQPGATARASTQGWNTWSEAAVQSALAQGRTVFVDFTAAWCVTCQVNKRLVLTAADVERRFDALNVARFRADWTNRDPAITSALARLERSGVPVYALYSPRWPEPVLLPEVLTRGIVLDALHRAASRDGPSYAMTTSPIEESR